ncbi:MAG: efflux RND transporter permease subunit, partial [Armatimonadota bacterium]
MWAFARTVISNRVTVSMVVLAAIVLGLVGLSGMPWEMEPDVDFPFVTVIVTYPGAGPDEIEEEVIRPLEDAVSVLSNVQHVNAVAQEGVGTVSVEFSFEADQDVAAADVRDAVARVKTEFPDDVDEPQVLKLDLGALPVMTIGVTGNRPPRDLRELVDDVITPRIGQVGGVASVSVTGGEEREIHVLADKRRLEAAGLSIAELSGAIASDNLNVPAGEIDEGLRNYRVRVFGRADDIDTIRNIRIDTPLGGLMRVADLADVVDSIVDTDEYARINGENVVSMRIVKQSGANTVGVADGVRAALDELDDRLAEDIEFTIANDDSEQVVTQILDVRDSIVQGTILAALVVFLFLHNVRGMMIAALVIPVSIIASFSLTGLAFDFTLN